MVSRWHRLVHFWKEAFVYFDQIEGTLKASALAYTTLISIIPVLMVSFGFFLAFPSFGDTLQHLHGFLFKHFVPASADQIQNYVEIFAANATKLSATGLLFFLFSGVFLIFLMESVFNSIWQVTLHRKGVPAFLMYWAILTLLPPLLGVALALSAFLRSLPYVSAVMKVSAVVVPPVLSWIVFLILYMAVPNCKVKFRYAALGAVVATVCFELMKMLFPLYVAYFPSTTIVYGLLAALPLFLLWLYVSWIITLFGAVVAYKVSKSR